MPKHTLIIVNKRVRQRFFQVGPGANAAIANPPQGTYVDNGSWSSPRSLMVPSTSSWSRTP